ncbi:unnamed protein product [marine sediment metagenome]|uniref:Uncharacterized protein n=1 Tax=marine sediment metagenome TaxID=412755 RepID=X1CE20_9ZZZZ
MDNTHPLDSIDGAWYIDSDIEAEAIPLSETPADYGFTKESGDPEKVIVLE